MTLTAAFVKFYVYRCRLRILDLVVGIYVVWYLVKNILQLHIIVHCAISSLALTG